MLNLTIFFGWLLLALGVLSASACLVATVRPSRWSSCPRWLRHLEYWSRVVEYRMDVV